MTQALWEAEPGGCGRVGDMAACPSSAPEAACMQRASSSSAQQPANAQPAPGTPAMPSSLASTPPSARGKRCSRCKAVKLLDQFCRDPTKKNGYQSWCKACYREHHEKRAMTCSGSTTESMCSICKRVKPASEFIKDATRATGLDTRCKECRRAHSVLLRCGLLEAQKRCAGCNEVKPSTEFKVQLLATLAAAMASSSSGASKRNVPKAAQQQLKAQQVIGQQQPEALLSGSQQSDGQQPGAEQAAAAAAVEPEAMRPAVRPAADALCRTCLEQRRQELSAQRVLQPTVAAKYCVRCQLVKPAAEFIRDTRKKTGLGPRCKCCEQEYVREKRLRKQQHQRLLLEQQQREQLEAGDGGEEAEEQEAPAAGTQLSVPSSRAGSEPDGGRQGKVQARRRQDGAGQGLRRSAAQTDTSTAGCRTHGAVSSSTSPAACTWGMEVDAPMPGCVGQATAELRPWTNMLLGEQMVHWPMVGGVTATDAWLGGSTERKRLNAAEEVGTSPQRKRRSRQVAGSSKDWQDSDGTVAAWQQQPSVPSSGDGCWDGGTCDPASELTASLSAPCAADVAAALNALCAWVAAPGDAAVMPAAESVLQANLGGDRLCHNFPAVAGYQASPPACDTAAGQCHDSELESECFGLSAAIAAVADGGANTNSGCGPFSLLPSLSLPQIATEALSPPRPLADRAAMLGRVPSPASQPQLQQQLQRYEPPPLLRDGAVIDADIAVAFWGFRSPDQLQQHRRHSEAGASDESLFPQYQSHHRHPQPLEWWCQWDEAQEQSGEAHQHDTADGQQPGGTHREEEEQIAPSGVGAGGSAHAPKQAISGCMAGEGRIYGNDMGAVRAGMGTAAEALSGRSRCLVEQQYELAEEEEEEQTVVGVQEQQQQESMPAASCKAGALAGSVAVATQPPWEQQQDKQQQRAVSVSSIRGPYSSHEALQGQAATSAPAALCDAFLPSYSWVPSASIMPSHSHAPSWPHRDLEAEDQPVCSAMPVPSTASPAAVACAADGGNVMSHDDCLLNGVGSAAIPRTTSVEEFSHMASLYLRSYEQDVVALSGQGMQMPADEGGVGSTDGGALSPGLGSFIDQGSALVPVLDPADLFQSPE